MHKTFRLVYVLLLLFPSLLFYSVDAQISAMETILNYEDGLAYELNSGPSGWIWVSDVQAEEVWGYDPNEGSFLVVQDAGRVSDARQDDQGNIWWVDKRDQALILFDPVTKNFNKWLIPNATSLYGTAYDLGNKIWLSQSASATFFSFNPATQNICSYRMSETIGGSNYIQSGNDEVWLVDHLNDRVHRFTPSSDSLKSWDLPERDGSPRPEALALEETGNLWWTDSSKNQISRLEPDQNIMTRFALPYTSDPQMLTIDNGLIWFTEIVEGMVGNLNPTQADGTSIILNNETKIINKECSSLSLSESGTKTTTSYSAVWDNVQYETAIDQKGWIIYQLPPDSFPFGITTNSGYLWFVDNGRQVLAKIKITSSITACKFSDADGELTTSDDRVPVAGWGMTLYQDDASLGTQQTGEDGCTSWSELPLGAAYQLQEAAQEGWAALEPANGICNLGFLTQVGQYDCDFVNWKEESNIFLPLVVK